MTNYTRPQQDRINRAWRYALEFASRTDLIAAPMLKDALRLECEDRESSILAKGILVNCLADNPARRTVADLYVISRGCQLAYILAAHWNGRQEWETIRDAIAEGALDYREGRRQ